MPLEAWSVSYETLSPKMFQRHFDQKNKQFGVF